MNDEISQEQFNEIVAGAIDNIPNLYQEKLNNVAFIVEDNPTPEQRIKLNLYPNETLFGLYEGVPLPQRGGGLKLLPDKITIFKNPLIAASQNLDDLKHRVGLTVWHEVAHYYGLDHSKIHALENKHIK
jgi:predicted Zn-dependent protease with MMP-like domain